MKRLLAGLLIFSLGGSVTPARAADHLDSLYDRAKQCYYGLKASSARRAERSSWMDCIGQFLAVYDHQPKSAQAYTSVFTAGRLYDRLYDISHRPDDRARSLHFYNKVIAEYGDGRLTDDALYHQGEILLAQNQKREALGRFKRVAEFYPDSDHMEKVEKRLNELGARVQAPAAEPSSVMLESIDYSVAADGSIQIVANASGPLEWTQNKLTQPARVYFNFPNARLSGGFARDLQVKGGALSRIRASQFNENTSRLVLDFKPVDKLKVTTRREGGKLIIALTEIELSEEPGDNLQGVPLAPPGPATAMLPVPETAPDAKSIPGDEQRPEMAEAPSALALLNDLARQTAAEKRESRDEPRPEPQQIPLAQTAPAPSVPMEPAKIAENKVLKEEPRAEVLDTESVTALLDSIITEKPEAGAKAPEPTKAEKEPEPAPIAAAKSAAEPVAKPAAEPVAKKPVATKPLALLAQSAPAEPSRSAQTKDSPARVAQKITTIVLDPGHGGKDFGAQGRHGLHEKEVNLKVSKRLKQILETRYKFRVVMTRDDDTFIPLDKRGDVANELGADLFVSVHANAAERSSAHGIETYYLGIGHSAQAQQTAARENGKLVQSVKDDQVQQILASLISTTKINDSAMLAGHVQDQLYKNIKKIQPKVKDLGVKEGPFFVLHDTNMPSILVEVGFVTHRREENSLKDPKYLEQLAQAIAKGIHDFLNDRGPTI